MECAHPNHKRSLPLRVEAHEAALPADDFSRRSFRFLWTGLGFAAIMLIGVSACPLSPHASAKSSDLAPELAFSPVALPALRAGGIRPGRHPVSSHTRPTAFLPGGKRRPAFSNSASRWVPRMSASSDDNVVESGSRDSGDDLSKRASSTPPDFDKPDIDVPVGDSTDPFDDVDWKPKAADSSLPEFDEHESTPVDEAVSVDDKTAPPADSAAPQINSESTASSEVPTAVEQGAAPVEASVAANSVKQEAVPVEDDTVPAQDMWQVELDKALLDLDLPPRERLELLQKALKNENLVGDVREALSMVQDRGFMDGHPDAIQKLFPSGTQSRKDLEQLQALRKQLPEAFEELQRQVKDAPRPTIGSSSVPTPPDPREVIKLLGQSVKSIAELTFDKDKQKEFLEEAKDSLRATPKGLETPVYEVKRVLEGPIFLGKPQPIEIREYEEFTVAQTSMAGGLAGSSSEAGGGFNTLASYLFGGNQDKTAMSMTVPVDISQTGDDKRASMSFVLPKKNADSPPTPMEGSGVEIKKVPSRLVVAKAFGGLTTEKEVERQKAAILEALATDGHYEAADAHQISVLSYNSPFTIPWRKRNEVVLVVTAKSEVMA